MIKNETKRRVGLISFVLALTAAAAVGGCGSAPYSGGYSGSSGMSQPPGPIV